MAKIESTEHSTCDFRNIVENFVTPHLRASLAACEASRVLLANLIADFEQQTQDETEDDLIMTGLIRQQSLCEQIDAAVALINLARTGAQSARQWVHDELVYENE